MMRRAATAGLGKVLYAAVLGVALAGCANMAGPPATGTLSETQAPADMRLDSQPRIAVMSAFGPELTLLLKELQGPKTYGAGGVDFTTGLLAGKPVVLFLSGISMVNATMNTQRVLDHFNVERIVFSGIAGGVDPALSIGDVTVPAQWGQYLEVLMARETAPGKFAAPPWMKDVTLPAFGMMHPRPVEVRSAAHPQVERKFWFQVDPKMLEVARGLAAVDLARCSAAAKCL
ncbi:MAG: 5'-methylthioadenosine/S-adenosylhomocysteine nucleosidase, partial [Burkholderiales bacterium]